MLFFKLTVLCLGLVAVAGGAICVSQAIQEVHKAGNTSGALFLGSVACTGVLTMMGFAIYGTVQVLKEKN